jgi:hypothetical protein
VAASTPPLSRPVPSADAIATLRENASRLDVEDVVDLCYAGNPDDLRVSIYLEALRGRGGEKAQVAACLMCFDLARRGDERREAELHLLLPTLDPLIDASLAGEHTSASDLIDNSMTVVELWTALCQHARTRDMRTPPPLPADDDLDAIDIDLFDDDEFAELSRGLQEIDLSLDLDEEILAAFELGLNPLIPHPPSTLFASESSEDLERVEQVRELSKSFANKLPVAADLEALSLLYTATHTRSLGLFGRRNRRRDRALADGLAALMALPAPPTTGMAWFESTDLPGASPGAWPKMAEVLLEFMSFVGHDADVHPERYGAWLTQKEWASVVAEAFVAEPRSSKIPPRLLQDGGSRRRR